jgi:hypothetical protein
MEAEEEEAQEEKGVFEQEGEEGEEEEEIRGKRKTKSYSSCM